MPIYRIVKSGEGPVGVIAATNLDQASAFAQGRYGAGATAEAVAYKSVLEAGMVCEILLSTEKLVGGPGESARTYFIL